MDLHELSVKDVLSVTLNLLGLTLTRLLGFTLATLILSQTHHSIDVALLLQADKLLRQSVHSLGDNSGLHGFSDTIHDTLLVVVDEHVLLLGASVSFPKLGSPELSNEVKTFLLTLEHHVLLGTASEESLEQDDGAHLLVLPLPFVFLTGQVTLTLLDFTSTWSMGSESDLLLFTLLVGLSLSTLLVSSLLDEGMGLRQGFLMLLVFARELFAEVEANLLNADCAGENLGLLHRQDIVEFLEALVARKSLRLNFVLVSLLVEGETITSDRSIDGRAEVGVLLNDITALGVDFDTLASFVHLAEHLDTLALNLGESTLFVLSLLQTDFLSALGVLFFKVTLALNKRGLKKVEALVLNALNFLLALVPLAMLLLLHESATQIKARLVTGRRERILERLVLAHLLDEVHLNHGGGQTTSEFVVCDVEHFGNVLWIDGILWGVGVGLGLGFSEDGLHFSGLGARLFNRDLGRLDALLRNLHHTGRIKDETVRSCGEDLAVTYISGGTDWRTGMIGRLKYLTL